MRYLLLVSVAFVLLTSAKPEKKLYTESLRPQFHFTPERNWMNDPNGLVYYDGEYHLFYQHNPNGKNWGFMHWGHAVSSDLLHWEHLPIAITPDENSTDSSRCTAYSGSAIVDVNNVAGFQKGDTKTLIIFYTSQNCGQRLAYSTDKGRTWIKYEKNPIIQLQNDDARDPKVFFHQPSGLWVMVLYRRPDNDEKKQGISIYNSNNLIDWEFQSHVTGFFECPDLFELPLDGNIENKKWALLGGDGAYIVGDFDGKKFVAQAEKKRLDYGNNFYATQTWSNQPEGKLIQIAWMRGAEYPEMPFNGQMSFPTELSLRTTAAGPTIYRKPIASISTLFGSSTTRDEKNYMPGLKDNLLGSTKGDTYRINAVFDPKTSDSFGFMIRGGKSSDGTEIRYETAKKILVVNGCQTKVEPVNGKITLEILVDRSSIELFCNDGEKVISTCFQPNEKDENIVLYTQGGELFVEHLELNKIKSVWGDK